MAHIGIITAGPAGDGAMSLEPDVVARRTQADTPDGSNR